MSDTTSRRIQVITSVRRLWRKIRELSNEIMSFTEVTYPDTSSITPRPTIKTTPEPVSVSVTPDADTYLVDGTTAHGSDEELKLIRQQIITRQHLRD